ncbi:kinase-like protein [Clavulina sp. PMI_390]|nr:kinase-like protein [Clavulina sp. PMI_390]
MAEKYGLANLRDMTPREAQPVIDRIYSDVQQQSSDSSEHPETLRLLQDMCHHYVTVPSTLMLGEIKWTLDIAFGGEAIVYLGVLKGDTEKKVVVRKRLPSREPLRDVIRLVHREAITHSLLNHPNILKLLGIHNERRGPPLTVLPFIEQGSLQQLLVGPLIGTEALQRILLGTSEAFAYLHSQHPPIVHGDVHPGNVLIGPAFHLYMCDFGASRIRHDRTRTLTIIRELGKCPFMAPELLMESPFRTTPESDIFGLAMIFLNTWSGQAPFHEATNREAESYIRKGLRPNLPNHRVTLALEPTKQLWQLLNQIWPQDRSSRPSDFGIIDRLKNIFPDWEQRNAMMLATEVAPSSDCWREKAQLYTSHEMYIPWPVEQEIDFSILSYKANH